MTPRHAEDNRHEILAMETYISKILSHMDKGFGVSHEVVFRRINTADYHKSVFFPDIFSYLHATTHDIQGHVTS